MSRFEDIKKMTRTHYQVDVGWEFLKEWIEGTSKNIVLDMNPPYQRGYVWSEQQKTEYVQYILKDGTSGKDIYWNCPGWFFDPTGPMELVDGKQRISAVLDFLDNKILVFGHFYKEYEDKLDFLAARFSMNVHDIEDPKDVVRWYIDMNTGGSIHTMKDLKPAYILLEELSKGK